MCHLLRFRVAVADNIRLSYLKIPLLFLSAFLLFSCSKNEKISAEYSDQFTPVYTKTLSLYNNGKTPEGLVYLDSAFATISQPAVNDKFRFYSFHYVYEQKLKHDYKQAFLYADSMLMMAKESVTREQYVANFAEGNYAKGDTYFSLKQYNDAYQCYFQGYLLGKSLLDHRTLADYTYRMGMIMYKQSHFKLAADYFRESYKHQKAEGKNDFPDFCRKQELLDNIALSYKHNGDIDNAIRYFDAALQYIKNAPAYKNINNTAEIANGVIYDNKAEVLILQGNNAGARELLKKSIAINLKKGGDNQDAEFAEIKLGQLFLDSHKNDSLFALLNNIRVQLDTVKNDDAEADWNRLMGKYYQQKNDLSKAITYIERYNLLKDSIIKRLSTFKESDVSQQLSNFEKQYEIATLSNNNKLQRIYLNVAIICSVMLLIIIVLVGRNWRRSKLDVATVTFLNEQINEQKVNLEKAFAELKVSSREKDRILRTVAHDLRNPLGGIASLTGIMVEETDHDPELKSQLKIIKDTSADTLELINEILEATTDISTHLKKQLVEVNSLLSNSIELLRFKAAEKHQQVLFEGLKTNEQLYINREMIWRVINNLITNAIKFSPVDETILVKSTVQANHILISITDHGIGIPDDIKDKVFNMFTDAKRPGTIGEKSFGLGLSICKQIIEKHHGKIWFESTLKKGTTFYIRLPKPKRMDLIVIDSELSGQETK